MTVQWKKDGTAWLDGKRVGVCTKMRRAWMFTPDKSGTGVIHAYSFANMKEKVAAQFSKPQE